MDKIKHISDSLIQIFSTNEAWEYLLIPYEEASPTSFVFLGIKDKDYKASVNEIKTIHDIDIKILFIDERKLIDQLNLYYPKFEKTTDFQNALLNVNDDFLYSTIDEASKMESSDIHIEVYEERCRVRFRVDGKLVERYAISKESYPSLINKIKIKSNLDISEKRLPQDGRILYDKGSEKFDLRVSVLPTIYGEKIVLRLLKRSPELINIDKLGFNETQIADYKKAIGSPNGLILISGPTGSGKTTTLYATLSFLNSEDCNIITIEDPIEYTLLGVNQTQLKEEIGLSFSSALKAFLRQDPDIIMLGEIRDEETAEMAIRSSLTGHLLLSTIHTNSAWGCVTRLKDMNIHPYLIADTLIATIAQRLVRKLCPYCKQRVSIENIPKEWIPSQQRTKNTFFTKKGCSKCFYTGFLGRKAIYEIILIDSFLSNAIREQAKEEEVYNYLKTNSTLKNQAINMLGKGETSLEEILPLLQST